MRDRKPYLLASVAVGSALAAIGIVALSVTDASAWRNPFEHRYLTQALQLCDRGTFYVGGAPKLSRYLLGPQAGQPVMQRVDPFGVRPLRTECGAKPTAFRVLIPRVEQNGVGRNFSRMSLGPGQGRLHAGDQCHTLAIGQIDGEVAGAE